MTKIPRMQSIMMLLLYRRRFEKVLYFRARSIKVLVQELSHVRLHTLKYNIWCFKKCADKILSCLSIAMAKVFIYVNT